MNATVRSRARALLMCVVVLLSSVALVIAGPTGLAWASGDDYPSKWKDVAQDSTTDDWKQYNRECTSWAAWALHSRNGFEMPMVKGSSGAADWGYSDRSGYGANSTPAIGSIAWWDYGTGSGHVAWVYSVSEDKKKVGIEDYNGVDSNSNGIYGDDGTYDKRTINASSPSGYIHFKDLDGSASGGGGSTPSTPSILALKRTTDPGGTRQVYAATKAAVTEAYWTPGGDGVHTHEVIYIAQENIVGFDKVNLPDGKQAVYAAVPDGIWETYWGGGVNPSSAKIVSGLSGIRQVIASNKWENGQFVHHLYVLADNGPYEVWWKDGGDGVHASLLNSVAGAVTMTKSSVSGVEQLYVATPTWVYELWWIPGSGIVHAGTILNISQGDIRSLSKGATLPDGTQLLYTGTSTTAWQSAWGGGISGISNGTIATNQVNAIQIQKVVTGDTHQLYLATGDHVQEYWWNGTGSGGGELIRIAQGNIRAFEKYNDGATQQLYTAAGNWVYETWWGDGHSPSSSGLFSVAR